MHVRSRLTEEYEVRELLGWGGNGAVLGAVRRADGRRVAVKLIYRKASAGANPVLPPEIRIMRDLRHSNILSYIDHFADDQAHYLVTEYLGDPIADDADSDDDDDDVGEFYCSVPADPVTGEELPAARIVSRGGAADMFAHIYRGASPAPAHTVPPLFRDVAAAVAHLHARGITHGDIKEENVLLTPGPNPVAKLCDFGHARRIGWSPSDPRVPSRKGASLPPPPPPPALTYYGTTEATPPELLPNLGLPSNTPSSELVRVSGFEADVWALGLLLYAMVMGSAPEDIVGGGIDVDEFETLPCRFRDDVDMECRDLVKRMLTIDPERRILAKDILRHPWLN
ncbi:kinase-like domain-containing protein, partial [Blyttiomyces helicus]